MPLSDVLSACSTVVSGVSGSGVVRTHELLATSISGLEANFKSGGILNACEIDRERTEERWLTNNEVERNHTIKFHFYYGVQEDANSRVAFRTLVEATVDAFRPLYNLSGVALIAGPLQIDTDGYIMKAGALLHYCQASLRVQEVTSV